MGKRILLAGVAGSVIVFLVGFLWHTAPGLGEIGIERLPAEDAVRTLLRASIHAPGLYLFPAPNMSPGRTREQIKADQADLMEKYRRGPSGLLVYRPGGDSFNFGKLLLNQFLIGLAGSLILAWILALTAGATSYGGRVLLVLLITLFGGIIYLLPYWNWYGFPCSYTVAQVAGWLVAWGAAALAMAAIVKPRAAA